LLGKQHYGPTAGNEIVPQALRSALVRHERCGQRETSKRTRGLQLKE